jgi:hypothetical protein
VGGSGGGGGYSGGHVVYGSHGYGVELTGRRHGFDASGPDFYVLKLEGADGFAEEGGFLVLGFGQGYTDFGVEEGYGKAGEACSRAQIEEGVWESLGRAYALAGEEAFAEVAADYLLGVADGGEVGAGVPLEEEIQVSGEPGHHILRWGDREVGRQELGDLGFR